VTDRQTDRRTEFSSLYRVCITCSAVTSTLSYANFTEGNILLKECTQTINNKIKFHILEVHMNELGNWLIHIYNLIVIRKQETNQEMR